MDITIEIFGEATRKAKAAALMECAKSFPDSAKNIVLTYGNVGASIYADFLKSLAQLSKQEKTELDVVQCVAEFAKDITRTIRESHGRNVKIQILEVD